MTQDEFPMMLRLAFDLTMEQHQNLLHLKKAEFTCVLLDFCNSFNVALLCYFRKFSSRITGYVVYH